MKHLQTYRLFESTQVLTEIQKEFLDQNTRGSWSLNPTSGDADVDGDFDCSRGNLKDFKGVRFGRVSGNFYCGNNSLTSLEGAPESVGGDFSCHSNSFTSLEGAPESVGGSFSCHSNSLTSLEGAPESVGGTFFCRNNSLTSLEGAPESVGGDFYCDSNSLTSLEGAPESVGGSFYCDAFSTSDWNLEGKLKILETGSEADKNLMATLVSPEALQKLIDQNPSKAAVSLKGVWKTLKSNPKYSNLEFPEGHSKEADLLADLTDVGL
jgi:hypothetical protein